MAIEFLLFGAGAIGAFYSSRLALNDNVHVSVICRSNYEAVKANGFSISSYLFGDYKWRPTRLYANPAEAQKSGIKFDFVIVSTKALPDVNDDSQHLEGLIAPGTAIVLIQNGIGIEEPYARRFPQAHIISASTITSAAQPEHGLIKHFQYTKFNSGPYPVDSEEATSKSKLLIDLLLKARMRDAEHYSAQKMQMLRWHKVAINAAMNPSSVLSLGTDNVTMATDPDFSELLKGVMDEVLTVIPKVTGEAIPEDFASSQAIVERSKKLPSGSRPSMMNDWDSGKKVELEVILGNPIRLAKEKGLDMPRLQILYALLKMAQKNQEQRNESAKL